MKIAQKSILQVELKDRMYELHCHSNSPLGELHDALMQMKGYVVTRMVEAQKEEQEVSDFVQGSTDVPPGTEEETVPAE